MVLACFKGVKGFKTLRMFSGLFIMVQKSCWIMAETMKLVFCDSLLLFITAINLALFLYGIAISYTTF